jgi:hypothetical protein
MPDAPSPVVPQSEVQFKTVRTALGTWKIFVSPGLPSFREFTSHTSIGGWPFLSATFGINPETGASKTAMGIVAIGRKAIGFFAIGQFALGILTIAQFGVGFLFLAQGGLGWSGIGQLAIAYHFAIGQVALAQIAIGQFAVGKYALGQIAAGKYVWHMKEQNPEAVRYFTDLWDWVKSLLGWA